MAVYTKTSVPSGARTLPREYYTSPDIFAREAEKIFARRWLFVGREEQLQKPGDYFLANPANESLIIVRGQDGQLRALYNVCRHRGTRICTEDAGKFTGSIMCPYHAWTYALDGRLTAARNMDGVPDFDKGQYPLKQAALATWDGFIFVNVAEDPEPFEQAYAPLLKRFSKWQMRELRVAETITYDLKCNWKLIIQNYSECYHCPLVHPQLDKLSPSDSGRNDLYEGPFLGGFSELRTHGTSLTTSGGTTRPPLGEVRGAELDRVYYYTIFPSMLLSLHPDYVMVHYVKPLAPNKTQVACAWLFDRRTMEQESFDPSDAVDFWDLTNRQDWKVNELTYLGLTSRACTPGRYSNAEALLSAFDAHYLRVMEG